MMLRREDDVFEAGVLDVLCPSAGVKKVGIEILGVEVVLLIGDPFIVLDPFVAGSHCIRAEMDEHAETVVGEPCGIRHGRPDRGVDISHCNPSFLFGLYGK